WAERLGSSLLGGVHRRHRRLAEAAGGLVSPRQQVNFARVQLNGKADALARAAGRLTAAPRRHLEQTARLLDSLSYQRVLDRGYTLVTDAKGRAVTSAKDLHAGEDITLRMRDGEVGARVSGTAAPKAKKPTKASDVDDKQGNLL
ncbi:MAG TPA: exodeoxyribonuclease VII large subunit, partial [Magnetovibrio sp.]